MGAQDAVEKEGLPHGLVIYGDDPMGRRDEPCSVSPLYGVQKTGYEELLSKSEDYHRKADNIGRVTESFIPERYSAVACWPVLDSKFFRYPFAVGVAYGFWDP